MSMMPSSSSNFRFPIGESDFQNLRKKGYTYVDKSLFIEEVMDSSALVLLFPRPRRFGKTLNLSMLRYFLERSSEDRRDLFAGLDIQRSQSAQAHFQKYPVIFLTLKDAKQDTWEECQQKLRALLAGVYQEHDYLLDGNLLSAQEKEVFTAVLNQEGPLSYYADTLFLLSKYLHKYHNQAPIVLIDEYDSPLHAAFDKGYYAPAISFFRTFLSAVLKDNMHLAKGVLTGILRVAKESIFSGLNNLAVFTLLNTPFSRWFGFTEKEVEDLVSRSNLSQMMPEIQKWYNGYLFGKTTVYNPWSVIRYLDNPEDGLCPYWVSTASNALIKKSLFDRRGSAHGEIEILLQGGCIEKAVEENIVMDDVARHDGALWNFLLFSGYLRVKELSVKESRRYAQLCIPNQEVMIDFQDMTRRWFAESLSFNESGNLFFQSLIRGDSDYVQNRLQEILLNTLSYHDLAAEVAYHTFILGMLVNLNIDYQILSNRESGYGRYDVSMIPKRKGLPGILIEFKVLRKKEPSEPEIEKAFSEAFSQMHVENYAHELRSKHVSPILLYTMVFSGKQVWVKHRLLSE